MPLLPLYVDMDGSLIRSDLLIESALKLLKGSLGNIFMLLGWLMQGKAHLKARIAARVELEAGTLPFNPDVLDLLRAARAAGRKVVLATASHARYANAVAAHLGLFDAVLASTETQNLSGAAKLAAIQQHAKGPFAYVGNEAVDLLIWRQAAGAVVVTASQSLLAQARLAAPAVQWVPVPAAGIVGWARALRLHQWAKNLLLFMPALPLTAVLQPSTWLALCSAFVCFGLCASSVYLLNDLLDLESDRAHTRKRNRPIPAGKIPILHACALFPVLLLVAFALALATLPWQFVAVLALYWMSTMAYSFDLKRRVLVDIMTLASLYTIRILAGSAVILVAPSFWILVFSMFLFLSLAAAKRYVELLETQRHDHGKVIGRGYYVTDMPFVLALGLASGLISVLIFALYVNDPAARLHMQQPYALWLVCPLLLYWISRVWLKASRNELHDDPVVFAVTDRISQIVALLGLLLVLVAARG